MMIWKTETEVLFKAESPLHRKSEKEISQKGRRTILGLALTANAVYLHKIGMFSSELELKKPWPKDWLEFGGAWKGLGLVLTI